MKTLKFILSSLVSLVIINTNAQESHIKCAPGCELANTLNGKNYVSCIDRVCPICHKKKETERKEQLESEKTEAQKRAQQAEQRKQQQTILIAEQKKQIAIQRQKAKENEVVLVAPTPNVENKKQLNQKNQILSKDDEEILDLAETNQIDIEGYANFRNDENKDDPLRASYYDRIRKERVTLKIIEIENPSEFYKEERTRTFLNNDGNFIFAPNLYNKQTTDYRIINLKGQVLFRNKMGIAYLDEGLYIIEKEEAPFKEILNIKTMESFPFPEELITNWRGIHRGGYSTAANYSYEGFIIAIGEYIKQRGIHIYATWNLKILREKGYEFYPQKKYSGADQMLPISYVENKDKCIAMFIFLHDLEDDSKITVKKISIYGFNSTENRFILFDQKNYSLPLVYHHLFTKYWFGNLK